MPVFKTRDYSPPIGEGEPLTQGGVLMPKNDPISGPPLLEVWLNVGETLRLGDRVLRVMDTDGDDTMLRIDRVTADDDDETRWAELPR